MTSFDSLSSERCEATSRSLQHTSRALPTALHVPVPSMKSWGGACPGHPCPRGVVRQADRSPSSVGRGLRVFLEEHLRMAKEKQAHEHRKPQGNKRPTGGETVERWEPLSTQVDPCWPCTPQLGDPLPQSLVVSEADESLCRWAHQGRKDARLAPAMPSVTSVRQGG